MLENARLLGDRRLAEEALDLPARSASAKAGRNLLSCKFIRIYFMKTSFPMARMIDHSFWKSAILKLPKLVTCPSLRLRHSLTGERGIDYANQLKNPLPLEGGYACLPVGRGGVEILWKHHFYYRWLFFQLSQNDPFDLAMLLITDFLCNPLCLRYSIWNIHLIEKGNDPRRRWGSF
jgi:hypothetical protein